MDDNNLNNNSLLSNDSLINSSLDSNEDDEIDLMKYYSNKLHNIEDNSQKIRKSFTMKETDNSSFNSNFIFSTVKRQSNFQENFSAEGSEKYFHKYNTSMNFENNMNNDISENLDNDNDNTHKFSNFDISELNKTLNLNLTKIQSNEIIEFVQELTNELDNMFKILNKYIELNSQKSKKIKNLKEKFLNFYEKYHTNKLEYASEFQEKNRVLSVYEDVIEGLDKEKNKLLEKIDEMQNDFYYNQNKLEACDSSNDKEDNVNDNNKSKFLFNFR